MSPSQATLPGKPDQMTPNGAADPNADQWLWIAADPELEGGARLSG